MGPSSWVFLFYRLDDRGGHHRGAECHPIALMDGRSEERRTGKGGETVCSNDENTGEQEQITGNESFYVSGESWIDPVAHPGFLHGG